jgi:hypothetical protein
MNVCKTIVICSILIFSTACDKNEENNYFKGDIVGYVNLIDEFGNEIEDKSGVNVSIDGLENTLTNDNGRFEFTDVPAGTYKLIYNKTGYGSYKRFSYQFIGGNVPAMVNETALYEIPDIEVKSLDVIFEDNRIKISVTITETNAYRFHIFFHDNSDVTNQNFGYFYASGFTGTEFFRSLNLLDTPYSPGDKIYFVIYFYNYHDSGYFDFESEKPVYPSHKKASDIISLNLE